jgi:hypothetical protein
MLGTMGFQSRHNHALLAADTWSGIVPRLQQRLYRVLAIADEMMSEGFFMPSGLEDRIHQLCAQAVAAKNEAELQFILPQLREAIRDHIRYCRALAVEVIPEAFGSDSNAAD